MTLKAISKTTPVTTAFMISACAICFWAGGECIAIKDRMAAVENNQTKMVDEADDWRTSTAAILSELKQLVRDNKMRLDYEADKK